MPAATAVPSQARAIFFLSIAAFAAAGTTRVMDAILPQIAQEFNVTIGAVAFVATAYAFTYGAFQLVFGPLGDRYGKYRVILFACIGSAVTTYVCAFAGSVAGIAGARLASGMMAAAIVPLAIAWVGDVVAAGERQHILARFLSGQILGLLAGQIGGGVLGEYFGWRSAFLFIGTVYLLAVAGLIFEMISNPATRAPKAGGNASFWQTWNAFLRLTSRPVVRFVLAMVAIEAFAMFGAFTYIGASLHYRFGFDFATIGLFLATYCLGGLFYVSQSRRLIGFLGPAKLAFWGTVLVAVTYVTIAITPVSWVYLPAIAVMGLGFYMLHNTLQTFATQMAPDARGSAVAIFATCYFLAQAVGVYLAGLVIDLYGTAPVFLLAAVILLGLGFIIHRFMPAALKNE
jgi:YNFM family putative membrane transporter